MHTRAAVQAAWSSPGAFRAARYREQQAEAQYKQALLQVQTEVMQAYRNYQSFAEQVNHYQDGLLRQAREVMDGKIYSYNRGEVSLLEVLDAQRTYDEVQAQYIETLFNYSSALVELERSAGIWDIEIWSSPKSVSFYNRALVT
jgi:cobalt-zinc-cadmium efflux system outer membrane protein